MQFQELIQSSPTKHVNTVLKYFFTFQDRCNNTFDFVVFRKLSELSDVIYRIKLASLDSKISKVFCHILTKNLLVRSSATTQK